MELVIIKAPNVGDIKIRQEISFLAPKDYIYFVPQGMSFETWGRTLAQAEREKNEWIRRYENMYQGLKYWREKAQEAK
jgi:hypothetical protein